MAWPALMKFKHLSACWHNWEAVPHKVDCNISWPTKVPGICGRCQASAVPPVVPPFQADAAKSAVLLPTNGRTDVMMEAVRGCVASVGFHSCRLGIKAGICIIATSLQALCAYADEDINPYRFSNSGRQHASTYASKNAYHVHSHEQCMGQVVSCQGKHENSPYEHTYL